MFRHLLVPLDGSALAECVLPHVAPLASALNARVSLLQVLELPREMGVKQVVDPVEWHLKKIEAQNYLERVASRLESSRLEIRKEVLEGSPADIIIDYADSHNVDLIILSTHGRSGLSGWNVSSVVQKIVLRCCRSIFLVRAYRTAPTDVAEVHYQRMFVGVDCSARADYVLPFAVRLAQYYKARLTLGTVIERPVMLQRAPLSEEDIALVEGVAEKNRQWATHYLTQLQTQFSMEGVDVQTRLVVSDNATDSLHAMAEEEQADLVLLGAHGMGGVSRYPYGSMATSFIAFGTTSLMIMQDLSGQEFQKTQAELATQQVKGH